MSVAPSRSASSPALSPASIRSILEAFALGDALGMPTEFMTRAEIRSRFGMVDRFLEPWESRNHPDLGRGRVTDDTEQVLALLDEYCLRGKIRASDTAIRLLRWVEESGAVEKKYIGPSSKAALEAIRSGADPEAGWGGTTCGGVMRSPAAILFCLARGQPLSPGLASCLRPTHNSYQALASAFAYARAMEEAIAGGEPLAIDQAARSGWAEGAALAPWEACCPSLPERLSAFESACRGFSGPEEAVDFLYGVFGTGLESVDVATAALCIFLYSPLDTWLCLRMGASAGGDTDTIAALAGALSAAHSASMGLPGSLPSNLVGEMLSVNGLDLAAIAARLAMAL
ncbi:MAG TPA: ADP-ribosylglycohydrolase family protein [Rectinemataceae bacterium]